MINTVTGAVKSHQEVAGPEQYNINSNMLLVHVVRRSLFHVQTKTVYTMFNLSRLYVCSNQKFLEESSLRKTTTMTGGLVNLYGLASSFQPQAGTCIGKVRYRSSTLHPCPND